MMLFGLSTNLSKIIKIPKLSDPNVSIENKKDSKLVEDIEINGYLCSESNCSITVDENNNDVEYKLKTNNNTQLYLTPESNATYGGNKSVGIENAVRFAFVEEGTTFTGAPLGTIQSMTTSDQSKVHIWEPNYDTHTEYGIENVRDVHLLTEELCNKSSVRCLSTSCT